MPLPTPRTGRIVITDGGSLSLTVPYSNADWAESGDVDVDGYETETVYARDTPIGEVTTKRSGKSIKFSALTIGSGFTVSIEDVVYKKGTWATPTSTAPGGTMSDLTHYTVAWQVNIGGTWTTQRRYAYCILKANTKEGSPSGSIDIDVKAVAYDDSWATYTTT